MPVTADRYVLTNGAADIRRHTRQLVHAPNHVPGGMDIMRWLLLNVDAPGGVRHVNLGPENGLW